MKRVEIIGLMSKAQGIVDTLQKRGAVELCNVTDEELVKMNTASVISDLEKKKASCLSAIETVEGYSEKKPSLLDGLSGKREVDEKQLASVFLEFEKYAGLCDCINDAESSIETLKNELSQARIKADGLKMWESLDIPTDSKNTRFTKCFIGTISEKLYDDTFNCIKDIADVHIISSTKTSAAVCVICLLADEQQVGLFLKELGFCEISDKSDLTPKQQTAALQKQIDEIGEKIAQTKKDIGKRQADLDDLKIYADCLSIKIDKYEGIKNLAVTKKAVVINGYIPEKYAQKLFMELERKYSAAVEMYDPGDDEDVPVLLENDRFSRPVEGITEMYALPSKTDLDPTPIMSFFYYLFFGMMLSDAGYGLVMCIVTTVALKKFALSKKMRETMRMFRYCGISTVFWGALFGSWYGDLPQVIARDFFGKEIGSTALWFEPINKPMKLLLFSFGLGIIHLFVGLCANFYKQWKAGDRVGAVCDTVPVMMTVLGAAPLGAGILVSVPDALSKIGGYLALCGVVLVVLTSSRSSKNIFARFFGGLYGLYNVATGYLSDILSYSRLLALGLATGCIAQVINLIGAMPSNPVAEGILLFILFLTAHTANIAINLLGAYVHTDRLQFVELFSKFYEGGGRAFEPLKQNTKYITLKEETSNE